MIWAKQGLQLSRILPCGISSTLEAGLILSSKVADDRSGYGDNVRAAGRRIQSQLVYRHRIEEIGVGSDKDAGTTLGKKCPSSP
ncbi:unnamed protein product [Sphagnum tenellum]